MREHRVTASHQGQSCQYNGCGAMATHHVGEAAVDEAATRVRHPLTALVCCVHFRRIFGEAAGCPPPELSRAVPPSTTRVQRRLNFAARVCEERGWKIGALTPVQLKELRRLQDEQPPSDAIPIHRPESRGDR